MPALLPSLKKSYWLFAALGGLYGIFMVLLTNPWFQRHALYAHKINSAFWHNINEPESFGFAKNQVTPFHLNTTDGETLYCWHVLPLDAYLEHENEIVRQAGGVVEDLKETPGYRLLKGDEDARVVVNFHGNAGHLADGFRTHTYRSITSIPKTHLLTCDYRGFGLSTVRNAPHLPTEAGLITDGISLVNYVLSNLSHSSTRTVLLGQSLGTAVTAATALHFTSPSSDTELLPPRSAELSNTKPVSFASIILVAPFPTLPTLLKTYRILGLIPVLSPLRPYPKLAAFLTRRIKDPWPTLPRLQALLTASKAQDQPVRIHILHARNDADINFRLGESLYEGLESVLRSEEGVVNVQERKSVLGGERVRRGAFAYRSVEVDHSHGKTIVELEVVRFGGHNEVVGFVPTGLAVRRAFREASEVVRLGGRPGLDVE
ncbi:hypothetical protein GQ43DRAFT_441284 [Delitschia confertaspora ATCC 74209]|uniref:AB hydrolase-1 domain-containing protein n=1 Tax=Delitschia confertaspora ATCC 74209 TaxID=1513339 RepID=A0A9P4JKB7_9PLEO|nr:hypothetical protein GQ43DRAFT_441284 [Delitschia confertaspora ATCC 74209]